jgi:hypothetical protein
MLRDCASFIDISGWVDDLPCIYSWLVPASRRIRVTGLRRLLLRSTHSRFTLLRT